MLDWGPGVRGHAVFGGRRRLGRGGRRGAGVGRGTSGLWRGRQRGGGGGGARGGGGEGGVAEPDQGVTDPAGELTGHRQGGPVAIHPGLDLGVEVMIGRGRAGGALGSLEQRPAQHLRPWRERCPGLRLWSELCTVTSRPVWRTTASPLAKRRASPSSARMVGAINIPIPIGGAV